MEAPAPSSVQMTYICRNAECVSKEDAAAIYALVAREAESNCIITSLNNQIGIDLTLIAKTNTDLLQLIYQMVVECVKRFNVKSD
jgi:hypothetical protein